MTNRGDFSVFAGEGEFLNQLKATKTFLETLLNSIGDIIFLIDDKGNITFSNKPRHLLKFDPEEFVGKNVRDVFSDDTVKKFEKALQRNREGSVEEYEVKYEISGDKRYLHIRQSPVFIENSFKGVLVIVHDITELRKAFEKLETSEERYRTLFENVPVGLYITTPEGKVVNVNPEAVKIGGYSLKEMENMNASDLYYDKNDREVWIKKILKTGHTDRIFRMVRKDGKVIWVRDVARLRKTKDGRIFIEGSLQDITKLKDLEDSLMENLKRMEELFESIVVTLSTTVEAKDPYTYGHQMRVAGLAVEIAKNMGLEGDQINIIRIAGLLHDIGKIAIPNDILAKPTKFTEIEYMLVKEHAVIGYNILKKVKFPWPVAEVVLQHHERIDGSGYPYGLKGDKIKLEAKILGVADVVEAMSSHRPYRPALGINVALEEIKKNRGILYDPEVVDACLKVFEAGFKFEEI